MFFTLGLPYSDPELSVMMLVMSEDLSVAHFTASAIDLAFTLITGKWAADTRIWWGNFASTLPISQMKQLPFLVENMSYLLYPLSEWRVLLKNSFPSPFARQFTNNLLTFPKNYIWNTHLQVTQEHCICKTVLLHQRYVHGPKREITVVMIWEQGFLPSVL